MSEQFPVVNVAGGVDTFGVVFSRLNSLILFTNTDCVSVNSIGGVTSGLGFVNGTFGSNTLVCSTIRGGNVTTLAPLSLSSNLNLSGNLVNLSSNTIWQGNLFFGNSTAAVILNSVSLTLSNATSNVGLLPTSVAVGSNAVLNTGALLLGNSTANHVLNSTADVLTNSTSTMLITPGSISVGANVIINTTTITIGSLTINSIYGAGSLIPTVNLAYSVGNSLFRWELFAGTGDFSGAVVTANDFSVAGNTSLAANLSVGGATSHVGNVVIQKNANVNQGLAVQGNSSIYAINATGNTILNGNLTVTGSASVAGNFNVLGSLVFTNTAYGNVISTANLTYFLGNSTSRWLLYAGNADFSNAVTIANTLNVAGPTTMNTLNVTGEIIGNLTSNVAVFVSAMSLGSGPDLQQRMVSTSTTGTLPQTIDTFIAASFRTAKYLLQIDDLVANNYYSSEILLMHDGANVLITEYAELVTNSFVGSLSANIAAGVVQLFFTPVSTSTSVKVYRSLITI